jgi:hypothetical protein
MAPPALEPAPPLLALPPEFRTPPVETLPVVAPAPDEDGISRDDALVLPPQLFPASNKVHPNNLSNQRLILMRPVSPGTSPPAYEKPRRCHARVMVRTVCTPSPRAA